MGRIIAGFMVVLALTFTAPVAARAITVCEPRAAAQCFEISTNQWAITIRLRRPAFGEAITAWHITSVEAAVEIIIT